VRERKESRASSQVRRSGDRMKNAEPLHCKNKSKANKNKQK